MKNIIVYYDPHLLDVDEDGESQETIASIKDKTAALRDKSPGVGVMLRDATTFSEVEPRTIGVVLLGDADSERLEPVAQAYEAAEIPVVNFGTVDETSFDLSSEHPVDELHSLKARATELGVTFNDAVSEAGLSVAIQERLRELGQVEDFDDEDSEDEGEDFDPDTADMEALKAFATENSVPFSFNIGEDTLRERVKSHIKAG